MRRLSFPQDRLTNTFFVDTNTSCCAFSFRWVTKLLRAFYPSMYFRLYLFHL